MTVEPEVADSEFSLDSAMDSVAEELGTEIEDAPDTPEAPDVPEGTSPEKQEITVRPPPKSWAKEKHEIWTKLPPEAQEYYELREKQMLDGLEQYKGDATLARQFKDIVTPYRPMLASMGISETDAVKYLLNAQYRLTNGSDADRLQAWRQMGAELGFLEPENQPQVDPAVRDLQEKLNRIEYSQKAREQQELQSLRSKADSEVAIFAADQKNVHFNEVAKDMVPFINAGLSIQDAYDRAVWANPLTRAKEQARLQTEAQETLKKKSQEEAEAARKAKSVNIRSLDSQREPTEPTGSMEDTMKETLAKIKRRVN